MLKVLVAAIPMPYNRFLVDLNSELAKTCEVAHDHERFWAMDSEFDIVHIHFPEYITFDIEGCMDADLTPEIMQALGERLRFWKARASIVVTRHVFLPHRRQDPPFQKLYELVYRYADAVVHFAEASRDEYAERYRDALADVDQRHVTIPHHTYESLPNSVTRSQARKRFGIPQDANVMLGFGSIQNDEETNRILTAFQGLKTRRKVLLASSWRETLPNVRWIRLRNWLRDLRRFYYRLHPRYHFHYGFVAEADVQVYVNACDVLLIPRGHVLNSGNMVLGFTFGRVVVGPDSGTVGQILRETGNPVFDPDRPETAVAAVENGLELAKQGLGEKNRQLALSEWKVEQCAEKYRTLFEDLIAAKRESSE